MFVTGCHRSGTSLLSSLLKNALTGGQFSSDGDLELKLENPTGFFESQSLVELNDVMLHLIGCDWDQPPLLTPFWDSPAFVKEFEDKRETMRDYALTTNWIDKDPRLCITYPAYLHILLKRVPLVGIIRKPIDVATSLYARNGFNINAGLSLWYIYNFHLASSLAKEDMVFFYEDLLRLNDSDKAQLLLTKISPFLEEHNYSVPNQSDWIKAINNSLVKNLNRAGNMFTNKISRFVNEDLMQASDKAYYMLRTSELTVEKFQNAFIALPRIVLDNFVGKKLFHSSSESTLLQREIHDANSLDLYKEKVNNLENELFEIRNSTSWKLTAPLRSLKNSLSF